MKKRILVAGAGGFIGHHMVRFLKNKGHWVRGVDIKDPEYSSKSEADEFIKLDIRNFDNCLKATNNIEWVFNFAANMGGIGYIETVNAEVMHDNVLINANIAEACKMNSVKKIFFPSSACIYSHSLTRTPKSPPLKETDAYPADPSNEYGWEKLFSERLYTSYFKDYGIEVRIARFHTIFGPETDFEGGREKAPAAICRKVALAKNGQDIEIWGDGRQTRTFLLVDDCVEAVYELMNSDFRKPLNISSDKLITINQMVDLVCKIANKKLKKKHLINKPQGVRGRDADNTLREKVLKWKPKHSLEEGFAKTYFWVESELSKEGRL